MTAKTTTKLTTSAITIGGWGGGGKQIIILIKQKKKPHKISIKHTIPTFTKKLPQMYFVNSMPI